MNRWSRKLYNEAIQRGIPILVGFVQNRQIIVWCPFCRKFHYHGAGLTKEKRHLAGRGSINYINTDKLLPGDGFRSPHCHNYVRDSLYGGIQSTYLVLNIRNFMDRNDKIIDPSYEYDKGLEHIDTHRAKHYFRYRDINNFLKEIIGELCEKCRKKLQKLI